MSIVGKTLTYFGFGSGAAPAIEQRETKPRTSPAPRARRSGDLNEIVTLDPMSFRDCEEVAAHFRGQIPVIVNIGNLSEVDSRRMLDFMVGLVSGLQGKMSRVTAKVFLLSPSHVNVTDSNDGEGSLDDELVSP